MAFEDTSGRNVLSHYGPRSNQDRTYGGVYGTKDQTKIAEWVIDYTDRPLAESTYELATKIPANARIVTAKAEIIAGFTSTSGTTTLSVGLGFPTNTDDPDGLLAAAELSAAAVQVVGDIIDGAGAFVGATIGSEAGSLTFTSTVDDLLTGKMRVLVEYMEASVYA